jgi:pyruvoyl-dependent arginine decarboxylase (PvlArgDC)
MASTDVATADAKITATNLIILSSVPSNIVEQCINSALPTMFQMGQAGTLKSAPAESSSPTVGMSWALYRRSPDGGCQGFFRSF